MMLRSLPLKTKKVTGMSSQSTNRGHIKMVPPIEPADAAETPGDDAEDVCPKCFGTGMEIVEGKGARPCECRADVNAVNPFAKVRVPQRYLNCHLNSYNPDKNHESQRFAVQHAMRFINEFPAVDQGLLLMGPVGVGKTHLAVSILKGLTYERGFNCLFYEFGALLKEIQGSYNASTKTSELAVLNPVLTTQVLVLDELGASKPTDWVKDTMAYIINARYNDKKHTIFTTNYLDERRGNEETLEDRIGVRLRSRLYEMCKTIEITGSDYRRNFSSNTRVRGG
jgi:DNA replication protein DnaC